MTKKEIDELLLRYMNLKHANDSYVKINEAQNERLNKTVEENEELKSANEFLEQQNETLYNENIKNKNNETIGHQQNEIETLKSEKEFLMQTINALTKLTNNLIK